MSAVILFVRRPGSDARLCILVVIPVPEGAAVTRVSERAGSKPSGDVSSGTVNGLDGFWAATLMPILFASVGRVTSVKSCCR